MSDFIIKTNSDVPIYRQIVEQVRRLAASGRLRSGDRLPSVRQLADELAINPMTISKAYSYLETEGLLERQRGIGMVMRGGADTLDELIRPAVAEVVSQAKQLGLDEAALLDRIRLAWSPPGEERKGDET